MVEADGYILRIAKKEWLKKFSIQPCIIQVLLEMAKRAN
jgi:hypothetical protein